MQLPEAAAEVAASALFGFFFGYVLAVTTESRQAQRKMTLRS
ncbi:MAG: hypothetical protein JWR27_2921 [Aeromicrobium sp.]|nr:hypothetical protein [Aeromicrobium sp.]